MLYFPTPVLASPKPKGLEGNPGAMREFAAKARFLVRSDGQLRPLEDSLPALQVMGATGQSTAAELTARPLNSRVLDSKAPEHPVPPSIAVLSVRPDPLTLPDKVLLPNTTDLAPSGFGLFSTAKGMEGGTVTQAAADAVATPAQRVRPRVEVSSQGAGGHTDVVIVQSGRDVGLPQAAGMLPEGPIYTVYLAVDGGKDWILEYTPVGTETGAAVESPYPLVTGRPTDTVRASERYVLLQGVIDRNGEPQDFRLDDSSVASTVRESLQAAIALWRFRPATEGGVPVAVRAVIAVPAQLF